MAIHSHMSEEVFRFFENGSLIYPQPVAMACGKIIRSRSPEELLDAILKGGEILARYLAIVSLASFSARTDENASLQISSELAGPLSFGTFLRIFQQTAKHDSKHLAKSYLQAGFAQRKKGGQAKANLPLNSDAALTSIVNLRNSLGHSLSSLGSARAISILKERELPDVLMLAIQGMESLLQLPLFVIEGQWLKKGKVVCQRLLLMGETSDPQPESIELSSSLHCDVNDAYIAVGDEAILLSPMVFWKTASNTANFRLFLFDSIRERTVKYKAVEVCDYEASDDESGDFQKLLSGEIRPPQKASLANGLSLYDEWNNRRKSWEHSKKQTECHIPWNVFSDETLSWYASKLSTPPECSKTAIQNKLLDGRDHLSKSELDQLILLFGKEEAVLRVLGRGLLDLQLVKTPDVRWDDRVESHANLIECMRLSVEFFSQHIGVEGGTLEGLKATSGSADYLAMREALVNLFIHQDYSDQSAAAQIKIYAKKAVFFNPGKSLVKKEDLIEGGKNQARNPVIARALRLIGFAELAGSGLRQLQNVWRTEHRRPPQFDSNSSSNTFTLTLDWRVIPDNYNLFWKERLGVKISEPEAIILNLSVDGVNAQEAASATGLSVNSAEIAIETLKRQALVDEKKDRIMLKHHLRVLIQ